jgi:hypothetical protein
VPNSARKHWAALLMQNTRMQIGFAFFSFIL